MAMTGMICICTSVIVCVPFKKGCFGECDSWEDFSGMPNNYLYRCQGWCYSATFPVKYLFSRPLGGGGGPRSVNGLYIYILLIWTACSPLFYITRGFCIVFSSTFIRSYTLSYVCYNIVLGFALPILRVELCFDFSPYGQNVAELRGEAWTTILGRKQFRLWEVTWPLFTQKSGYYYLSTIGGSKLALF